jgi:putative endonuclease
MAWMAQMRWNCLERVQTGLDWLAARRGRTAAMPAHLTTGMEGEDAAFFHLNRRGYQVVARRWSAGNMPGDVDLIAWHRNLLCFVEVKTRTAHDATAAEVAVDWHKRRVLRRLARNYVRQLPHAAPPQVRFDVVSVYLVPGVNVEITHFENAFGWDEWRRDWE